MSTVREKNLRDLAVESPAVTRVLEKFGIDYCCGGIRSLRDACRTANLNEAEVLTSLKAAQQEEATLRPAKSWSHEPLADLIAHITITHHQYVREESVRLRALLDKVCSVHSGNHPELLRVRATFDALAAELATHMMKEEKVLFPYIERMDEAVLQGEPLLPAPFGTVANPVAMMKHEHDDAGEALRTLRTTTSQYTAPPDGCVSYKTLYAALAHFEADLHQHIHLENNILFPRAIDLEKSRGRA